MAFKGRRATPIAPSHYDSHHVDYVAIIMCVLHRIYFGRSMCAVALPTCSVYRSMLPMACNVMSHSSHSAVGPSGSRLLISTPVRNVLKLLSVGVCSVCVQMPYSRVWVSPRGLAPLCACGGGGPPAPSQYRHVHVLEYGDGLGGPQWGQS